MNRRRLEMLHRRSLVLNSTRDFFTSNGYLEVDTPIRCPAVIPEAHIDPVMSGDHFLQASPELFMKRLLAMGADKLFQICKCFRKGEKGHRHLPELTLLEWYAPGQTYADLMDQCQGLLRNIGSRLATDGRLVYQGTSIDISAPFERLTVHQAFERFSSVTVEEALADDRFDEILSFDIEPHLGIDRPCFLTDYPAALASLARLHPRNNNLAQRFELYVAGLELANGFTELTDPAIQRDRFVQENRIRSLAGRPALPMPETFLSDLARMPEAAGIALGMDRLVMLFCDAPTIDDVVAFPPHTL